MESGNPVPYRAMNGTNFYEPAYQNITRTVGCADAVDTLECLRQVSFQTLNAALNTSFSNSWYPIVDGDFIQKYPSIQLAAGDFVHVPVISGANTDEGTAFTPQVGYNTTQDVFNLINGTFPHQLDPKTQNEDRLTIAYFYIRNIQHWPFPQPHSLPANAARLPRRPLRGHPRRGGLRPLRPAVRSTVQARCRVPR